MTGDPLLARLHRNVMTVSSWNGDLPGGTVDQGGGELLYSASPSAVFLNGVFREPPYGDAGALLERATAFFADRGDGFIVYVHPDDEELDRAALSAGLFEIMPRYPEMVCRAPLATLPGDVRPLRDAEDATTYWRICDAAYPSVGIPSGSFTRTFTADPLFRDGVEGCLAYADGEPVACASIWMADGIGMVGWVAALPEARGRGLAAAATVWATNRAFALGADAAALQASVMGEPIYERLGYEEVYSYRLLGRFGPP